MAKFVCKYCGMTSPVYKQVGPHTGEWCQFCQRWIRWVPKKESKQDDAQEFKDELNREEPKVDEVPW